MADKTAAKKSDGIGDEAVQKATGKTRPEWFAILDKAGGKNMNHKEIVAYLHNEQGIGPWWQQMVTVEYERARGMRQKHETTSGFQVGASKTVAVPLAKLYDAWEDEALRSQWLSRSKSLKVHRSTAKKSMRATWGKEATSVDVGFYAKGAGKSMVALEHSKLASAADVEKMKEFWRKSLEKMKGLLEG